MPHDALLRYLDEVEDAVGDLAAAYVELYEEEFLTSDRVNLRIRVRFYNGCLLQLNESVIFHSELEHLGYRYHFQGKSNELIFRYDNTPHFPDLPNFPNHKHQKTGVDLVWLRRFPIALEKLSQSAIAFKFMDLFEKFEKLVPLSPSCSVHGELNHAD